MHARTHARTHARAHAQTHKHTHTHTHTHCGIYSHLHQPCAQVLRAHLKRGNGQETNQAYVTTPTFTQGETLFNLQPTETACMQANDRLPRCLLQPGITFRCQRFHRIHC